MRRASWLIGMALAIVLASGAQAWAQVCSGAVPISNTQPFQAGASVLFAEDTTGFAGIVQGGNSNVFGGLQIGRVNSGEGINELSATSIGGRVGAQFTYELNRPVHVCPVFSLSRTSANDAFDIEGFDVSNTAFAFGADAGLLVWESGTTQVVPTAGLYFTRFSVKQEIDGEEIDLENDSESGMLLNLGVGVLFNQRFSVTPLVTFPLGFGDETNPSFSITALYSFGRR